MLGGIQKRDLKVCPKIHSDIIRAACLAGSWLHEFHLLGRSMNTRKSPAGRHVAFMHFRHEDRFLQHADGAEQSELRLEYAAWARRSLLPALEVDLLLLSCTLL